LGRAVFADRRNVAKGVGGGVSGNRNRNISRQIAKIAKVEKQNSEFSKFRIREFATSDPWRSWRSCMVRAALE
jgi:hypothetical protein